MYSKKILLGLALSLAFLSCSKEDATSTEMDSAKKVVSTNIKIDEASNDLSDITDNLIMAMGGMMGKSGDTPEPYLPACVTVEGSYTNDTWTKTLTFTNCTMPNGNVLDGTLTITAVKNAETHTFTITHTFTNFHHNGIKVEGTRTVVKSLKTTDTLAILHPVDTITMNMTFTFTDGSVHHTEGTRIREMIEGFLTPMLWHDDVFSITGNWINASADGTCNATITSPLILKLSQECHGIVQGVITFVKNDKTIVVDYGTGACDKTATVTIDGKTETITIGKK